jgi:hypothetical protein
MTLKNLELIPKVGDKFWGSWKSDIVHGNDFVFIIGYIRSDGKNRYGNTYNKIDLLTLLPKSHGWRLNKYFTDFRFSSSVELTHTGFWIYQDEFLIKNFKKFE